MDPHTHANTHTLTLTYTYSELKCGEGYVVSCSVGHATSGVGKAILPVTLHSIKHQYTEATPPREMQQAKQQHHGKSSLLH